MITNPDPARISFFNEHKKEINDMVNSENCRRVIRKVQLLSDEEIYDAVGEIMSLAAQGQRIRAFRFPNAGVPIEPQRDASRPFDPRQATQRGPKASNNSCTFEAVVCANGFLLNVASSKGPQSFIFKTEDDLMAIFRETVFAEFERLKATKEKTEVTHVGIRFLLSDPKGMLQEVKNE